VISVDPAYRVPRAELVARTRSDLIRIADWFSTYPDQFDWPYLGSVDSFVRGWELAVDLFAADFAPDGERYVSAALPALPSPDDHFDLVLSSHLLFSYPDHLDFEEHVAPLLELVRVTRGEVRVFPLVDTASRQLWGRTRDWRRFGPCCPSTVYIPRLLPQGARSTSAVTTCSAAIERHCPHPARDRHAGPPPVGREPPAISPNKSRMSAMHAKLTL